MRISGLREASSSFCRDGATEKGSIVDNDGVGSTGLEMSDLGGISSSLRHEGRLRRH